VDLPSGSKRRCYEGQICYLNWESKLSHIASPYTEALCRKLRSRCGYRSTLSQAAQSVWLQKHSVASCAVGVVTEALCRKLRSWCGYRSTLSQAAQLVWLPLRLVFIQPYKCVWINLIMMGAMLNFYSCF